MAAKRFAAIDIGTNTILLLVAELEGNGSYQVLEDHTEITRLGEGVDRNRRIGPAAEQRSFGALKKYLNRCADLAVNEITVVGTSALRDANNTAAFQSRVKRELGLEVRVLSAEEEARYSYLAVERGLELKRKEILVVDVGGGSTEFIWGKNGMLHRWASLDLGSVRLTERFLPSDPVRDDEVARLAAEIDLGLKRWIAEWSETACFSQMVGIAGTFTTLAAVKKGLRDYSHSEVHGSLLNRTEVVRQAGLYQAQPISERKKIAGLEPKRADVILAGAVLVEKIMCLFGFEEVVVSDQGIRFGLLYERL